MLELVRNSYDADARSVEIRFSEPEIPERATLEIRDNGHGMTKEILLGPWLEPATDHKTAGAKGGTLSGLLSPKGRRRLGSKGVGRFAAQRLGHHLRVSTRCRASETHLEAEFEWQELDGSDRYLDQLSSPWRELKTRRRIPVGTSLRITQLRDPWTGPRFEQLRLGLSRLLGPGVGRDEFAIVLVVNGHEERIRPFVDALKPMYSIAGEVKPGGQVRMTYRDISGARETWLRSVLWPPHGLTCGGFRFRVNAWDLDKDAIEFFTRKTGTKLGLRELRRLIRDHSGISLYRDGFRILPYGESDNDWLRLDRRRVNNPTVRLSNNQVLGWVQITAEGNGALKDQTNREGLVANEGYSHLQHVLIELLTILEARRFSARRAMPLASRKKATTLPTTAAINAQVEDLLEGVTGNETGATAGADELRNAVRGFREDAMATVRRYSGLAATGQLTSLVISRVTHPIEQLESELRLLRDELMDAALPNDTREVIADIAGRMDKRVTALGRIMARLDPLARPRGGHKLKAIQLEDCVSDVAAIYSDRLAQTQVDFQLVPNGRSEVRTDLFVTEQVLAILFDNAVHWLSRVKPPRVLRATLNGTGLVLENNGPSVPKEHRALIFEPHFTTREDATGMGLALARDLLTPVGGSLVLRARRKGVAFELVLG